MTSRERPTPITHFTHVAHLATIISEGLLSDTNAQEAGLLSVEVGNAGIKDNRRRRPVPELPGGCVADYVPFYFGPRSPMMFAIANGNVPTYTEGTARLIYLVTDLDTLVGLGHQPILTDRNAALDYAAFRRFDSSDDLDDGFIHWDVMNATYWTDYDDGRELRMAEALVHRHVGWAAFTTIGVQNEIVAEEVREVLDQRGATIKVSVVPGWYF